MLPPVTPTMPATSATPMPGAPGSAGAWDGGVKLGLAIDETGQLDWGTHMPMYTSTRQVSRQRSRQGPREGGGWSPPLEDSLRAQRRECHLKESHRLCSFSWDCAEMRRGRSWRRNTETARAGCHEAGCLTQRQEYLETYGAVGLARPWSHLPPQSNHGTFSHG